MSLCPSWYALTAKPRHEKAAAQALRLRGLQEFLPLQPVRRLWSDRIQTVELPLFSGYLFCRFSYSERLHVLSTPGVISIVGFGAMDMPVEDPAIESLRLVVSSGLPTDLQPFLRVGSKVSIMRGPLEGVQGTLVREKGVLRVVVNIDLLRRSVAAEVDRADVSPCPTGQRQIGPD
jgi:transcription antitermination factor NusG